MQAAAAADGQRQTFLAGVGWKALLVNRTVHGIPEMALLHEGHQSQAWHIISAESDDQKIISHQTKAQVTLFFVFKKHIS